MPAPSPKLGLAEAPGAGSGRALAAWALGVALVVFLALGIPQTGRPLHGDEVEFVRLGNALVERGSHQINRGFIDDVVETSQMQSWNFHPPLYMWGLGLASKVFGVSEFTVRGFGLACGVASLLLVFAIARRAAGASANADLVGALAAGLCAVNPFFVQGCLMIDIDGSVYTLLFLLLTYAVFRLEPGPEWRRLVVMAIGFAVALSAKMTTVLVFPVVLAGYHAARGEWRRALGDGLVIGLGGGVLFLTGYWGYAQLVGLNFPEVFTHTQRSGAGIGAASLFVRGLVFLLPLPLLWGLFASPDRAARVPRIWSLGLVACGLGLLYLANLLRPELKLWIGWRVFLMSFYLVTVPFCTPVLLGLFHGALAERAERWIARRFEPIDFAIGLTVAVLVTYVGVLTRGGTFSYYQAPVIPLMAIGVAQMAGTVDPSQPVSRTTLRLFGAIVVLTFVYGLFVIGDSYFLTKYRLFDVKNGDVFGAIVRWWAREHADDPSALRTLANNVGYQPFGLAAIWYGLLLAPMIVVGAVFARRLGMAAALGAAAIGLGMGLSASQAAAHYRTNLHYGRELESTRQMADFINSSVELKGYCLAPRGIAYYLRHSGYIDDTRYSGGYRHKTVARINQNGELVLVVDETARATDALPQAPIHFAIGQYPLLDQQPTYRVIKQFGAFKLYAYAPDATGPVDPLRPGGGRGPK